MSEHFAAPFKTAFGLGLDVLHSFLGLGIMRVSLAVMLPFVLMSVNLTTSTVTIEVPNNFCELDKRDQCKEGQCLRYDPRKFKSSPSVVTYFPGGRLGNMISAYLGLLWVQLDTGLDVYYEKESRKVMDYYFENIEIPALEDSLCEWRQFPWKKYEADLEFLTQPQFATGQAIKIWIDKANYMRQEIQGGRKFYKKYKKESMKALTFRKQFRRHAEITLNEVTKKFKKSRKGTKKAIKKKDEITYVGVHNRRTDYLEFRKKRLGLENLYEDYFQDAMEYYKEEYDHPVFIFISDDMKWGRRSLKNESDIFFSGCGDPDDMDCIGKDLALLAACNHTVTTHGSFGHWAAYMAGGEIYTEYGAIVPDAYV